MKLGTETGSLINHLCSHMAAGEITIGGGATLLMWSDRKAATVTKIEGNIVTIQIDNAERVDANGMSEDQEYEFEPNKNGATFQFRIEKNGAVTPVFLNTRTKRWNKSHGASAVFGHRDQYRDYSF